LKWALEKKIPSYRQEITRAKGEKDLQLVEVSQSPVQPHNQPILQLHAPNLRDPESPVSPPELRASIEVWETLVTEELHEKGKPIKAVAKEVLNKHPTYKDMSESAKERIATVVNWKPQGGAPKTPGS
jgi:hypothetical protein